MVLGYYFNSEERAVRVNALPAPVLPRGTFAEPTCSSPVGRLHRQPAGVPAQRRWRRPLQPCADFDGISRRVPLLAEFDGEYYEALSLAMVRALLARGTGELPTVAPGFPKDRPQDLEWLDVGGIGAGGRDRVRADSLPGQEVQLRVRLARRRAAGRIEPEMLQGQDRARRRHRAGSAGPARHAGRSAFPGVEIHASLIVGILDNEIKHRPWYTAGAEVFFLLVGGFVLAVLIPRLSALWATAATAAGMGLMVALNVASWHGGMVLPLASSLLVAAAIYTMNMAYGYFVESRSKRLLAGRFGEYVPPELVDQMARDPHRYTMEPRSAELTILFSDVRGFTSISEALGPEELREYINEYLTEMSTIIRNRYRGTLDKYIGDAIMAFWGAPVEDPDHARNAVLAALDMQRECATLNAKLAARGWPRLSIGVGVNTGNVRVGDMGSRVRRAYTAMGDAVNVASRLEGRTKTYGVGILVGEATRNRVKDVVFKEIDRIRVKGKEEAVTIYEPLDSAGDEVELRLWEQALGDYRARRWNEAEMILRELARMRPGCGPYAAYLARLEELRARRRRRSGTA